ncbi:MAG: GntR family transcriptional regulator [Desulfobacterales bacterium]
MNTNLSEFIFKKLQKEILAGKFPAGARLPSERVLSEKFKVSRITIRDAIRKLSQLGFVHKKPQSGTYVSKYESEASLDLLIHIMQTSKAVDSSVLISLMEFRRVNEVFAAAKAAKNATPEDIVSLQEIIDGLKRCDNDLSYLSKMDFSLHYKIALVSGNLLLKLMFNSFKPVYHFYTDFFYRLEGAGPDSVELHQKLVSAISAGDEDYAAFVMGEALIYAENRMKSALGVFSESRKLRLAEY